jgi:hypothetical protein
VGESGPEPVTFPTAGEIVEAPIVDLTGEPDPPPEPTDDPADEPGFSLPDIAASIRAVHEIRIDPAIFRAAVDLGINDVPAPAVQVSTPAPAPEPAFTIDLPAFRRALKEAAL